MFKLKKTMAAMGVAALATVGLLLAAPAANAAPQDYCPLGAVCVWDDPGYNTNGNYGALLGFQNYVTPMTDYHYYGTNVNAGNTADSWYNHGRYATACFYDGAGYSAGSSGTRYECLNPGDGDGNIANNSGIITGIGWDPNSAKFV